MESERGLTRTTRGMLLGGAVTLAVVAALGGSGPERTRRVVERMEIPAVAGNCSLVTIRGNRAEVTCPNGDAPVNDFATGMKIDSISHEPNGRTTWIIEDVNDPD